MTTTTVSETILTTSPDAAPAPAVLKKVIGKVDSHGRALAKAVTWRVVGTTDTFVWALLITHKPLDAAMIGGFEVFTKIVLYYLHERLWRLLKWAPQARTRSLVKSISWRLVGSLDTFILSYVITGKAHYAVSIMGAEAITKIVLYYFHERIWRRVSWGRLEDTKATATAS